MGGGGGYWACMHLIWNLQASAHREAWGEVLVYSTGEDELIVSQKGTWQRRTVKVLMLQLVNCIACDALRIQNIFKDSFGIKGGR